MITYDHIMIRFGELSTKGKNKKDFIRTLAENVKNALKDWPELSFETRYDHIYVGLNGLDYQPVIERLQDVSGIHALSLVYRCDKDVEAMKESALRLINEEEGKTFTDDASCHLFYGGKVGIVLSNGHNQKITRKEDIYLFQGEKI